MGDYEKHKVVKKTDPRRLLRARPPLRQFGFHVEKVWRSGAADWFRVLCWAPCCCPRRPRGRVCAGLHR
jgi:hypothetical protein